MKKILILILIGLIVWGIYYFYQRLTPYTPPEEEADNRFGFLVGPDPLEYKKAREIGAAWIRPHPGPFIWGEMQSQTGLTMAYGETDQLVQQAQKYDVDILATLWPYATWDQIRHPESRGCKVEGQEFLEEFGLYRCNPFDWEAYQEWVRLVVERYDGDGNNDMPGLESPIKYWEVMNEPDLKPHEVGGLQFYVGTGVDYRELLRKTSEAIKSADEKAKVLIAGAAGGSDQFLSFYREVFEDSSAESYFDIANIHCISSDSYDSLNVVPYKKMLDDYGLSKEIWVTEAETFVSNDPIKNATQLKISTQKSFEIGAKKIFYTSMNLSPPGDKKTFDQEPEIAPDTSLDIKNPVSVYRNIFESI